MTSTRSTRPENSRAVPRRRLAGLGLGGALAVCAAGTSPAQAAGRPEALRNPGFAEGTAHWSIDGPPEAVTVTADGEREHVLHLAPAAGEEVVARQQVVIGRGGDRVLRARIRAGGDGTAARLEIRSRVRKEQVHLPVTGRDGAWLDLAVGLAEARGVLEASLRVRGGDGAWASIDDLELLPGGVPRTVRGVDLSGVPKNEAHGAVYVSADGTRSVDPVEIMAEHGATLGRLRVWVDPVDGWCTPERTVEMARRIRRAGMDVLVDFHYSDEWTDPGAQLVPAAWSDLGVDGLVDAVAEHTRSTLLALREAGIDVAMVQVGNEINPGMLWPHGQTWDVDEADGVAGARWEDLCRFLAAGSQAVAEVFPRAEVMLHLTNIHDGIEGLTWWFEQVLTRDVPFDLIGLSYYPYWHGTLGDLQEAVAVLSERCARDVVVVETAYPFTLEDDPRVPYPNIVDGATPLPEGYPATPAGQAAFFRAVQDVTVSAAGGRGRGAVYWEPAWTAVEGAGWDLHDPASGNAWENQAMFDHEGRALPEVLAALS